MRLLIDCDRRDWWAKQIGQAPRQRGSGHNGRNSEVRTDHFLGLFSIRRIASLSWQEPLPGITDARDDRLPLVSKAWRTQSLWAFPEVDGEHETADDEPALGSLDQQDDQQHWAAGGRRDAEQDLAESGIADLDGLLEQIGSPDCMGAGGGSV